MGHRVNQPVASLPKPRYSSRPGGVWPQSQIHPVPAQEPVVSDSSSMFDLQAQARSLPIPSEPVVAEPGVIDHVSRRLKQLRAILARVAEWWMKLHFRHAQLPILVLALGVWAVTARMAWQGEESATPLLRESISEIRQERTKAAMGTVGPALAPRTNAVATTASMPAPTAAPAKPAASVSARPQPATTIQRTAQTSNNRGASGWLASIQSWFSPEPAAREKVQGDPHRRVWVDMKTGLYYCPGADHYGFGGRERGKVMFQRDAEYEYFQPATGAPCQ
ncbi:MAG TPA: hypothetical protein VJ756_22640 [Terriglobales bacterium]|nr:hypothetical protein [Terriglobales bacterium]